MKGRVWWCVWLKYCRSYNRFDTVTKQTCTGRNLPSSFIMNMMFLMMDLDWNLGVEQARACILVWGNRCQVSGVRYELPWHSPQGTWHSVPSYQQQPWRNHYSFFLKSFKTSVPPVFFNHLIFLSHKCFFLLTFDIQGVFSSQPYLNFTLSQAQPLPLLS